MKRKIAQKNSPPFEPNGGEFSKDVTNVCKGLAVALLLCHHAFTGSSEFLSTIVPDIIAGVNITASVGAFGKICVTIFLTLSGYGLYRKYSSDVRWEQAPRAFIYNSLIKLLVIYQFIYLLALPINVALGRSIMTIYGDKVPLVNAVVDFFGLSYLFQFLKLNPTMWYMSLAIVSVLLFPFLKKQTDRYGVVPLVLFAWLAHALASDELIRDFGAFLSGILIARYDLFERIRAYRPFGMVKEKNALLGGGVTLKLLAMTVILAQMVQLRMLVSNVDYLIAPFLICWLYCYVAPLPGIRHVLAYLGRHSGNIFMTHSYFLLLCPQLVYWNTAPVLIFATLLVLSLAASYLVIWLFRLFRVDHLQKYLLERWGSVQQN
ncbi:acyltransferase family protein [Anaerotruncus colihominis]|uniref:Acyltransferase n=2 Tax=Anaerotruncus colihominis TaxID=169435 RepID=A0A845T435_9FIRM|nr:acyltransferase [Anaerotruncus colihominis]MCR2026822.1 acyltransferase [Anaerotruncus colihominis]NDO40847.1 acyltransferase [Anaerotruncus colihominis]